MDGDLQTIYDAIIEIKVKQAEIDTRVEERHLENTKSHKSLSSFIRDVYASTQTLHQLISQIPCDSHKLEIRWIKKGLWLLGSGIVGIFGIISKVHGWW